MFRGCQAHRTQAISRLTPYDRATQHVGLRVAGKRCTHAGQNNRLLTPSCGALPCIKVRSVANINSVGCNPRAYSTNAPTTASGTSVFDMRRGACEPTLTTRSRRPRRRPGSTIVAGPHVRETRQSRNHATGATLLAVAAESQSRARQLSFRLKRVEPAPHGLRTSAPVCAPHGSHVGFELPVRRVRPSQRRFGSCSRWKSQRAHRQWPSHSRS